MARQPMKNFAIAGVGGYVAPRHLKAIRDTGNRLVAALDPNDSVGVLDQYTFDASFFTEVELFGRHLDELRRASETERVHYLSVTSPNHLHDAHCRLGLGVGADVICEKPLVIDPWNVDTLAEMEHETGRRIWTVLQLRTHDRLCALKRQLVQAPMGSRHDVVLTCVTARGPWYDVSWKGNAQQSGGVSTNIGIHFFDILLWLFGPVVDARLHLSENRRMAGYLELERARVRWFLSVETNDLPAFRRAENQSTFRVLSIDGSRIEFSDGFSDLHTRVYEWTLAGEGFGLCEVRPAIQLTYDLRNATPVSAKSDGHPHLSK